MKTPVDTDLGFMHHALLLAQRATMATAPNPKVGCVLVKDGQVIGEGWTQALGQAHAEVQAINDAVLRGHQVRGATAYVSLEPCSHYGRTPPCVNALVAAGIVKVFAALEDANPQVAGRGFKLLREAGIEVHTGLLAHEARELNLGFFKRMETGKPWVRMKIAASLDGITALQNGQSQWITESDARQDGHVWRSRANAILTGSGTVLADDPQMNVRGVEAFGVFPQPTKIVLDSQLTISPKAKVLQGGALIMFAQADQAKQRALKECGAELICLPDSTGRVDLNDALIECGRRQINELHVEAGAILNGALIEQNHVDELLLYLAPKLLGSGRGMFGLRELKMVNEARELVIHNIEQIGQTLRILARFKQA